MPTDLILIKHRTEGSIVIDRGPEVTTLTCHWPFDLSTDEWIDINLEMESVEYLWAVRSLLETGTGRVAARRGGGSYSPARVHSRPLWR